MTPPRWTAQQIREHYKRMGIKMPDHVKATLASSKKQAAMPIRYFAHEPAAVEFELPFVAASRNVTEAMNHFARARSKKAFIAAVHHELERLDVYAFRSRVEIAVELHFKVHRERDEDNWAPKWIGDSLKGYLFADDAARYVTWRAPVFVVDGTSRTVIRVRPIGDAASPKAG